ncbi:hypothetical protein GCM10011415_16410 [Salipiger pallidus]|uniref:LysM domain-containing protein n=1 Tax=Salipiger pallidus TaxID=1775170 RepID=A0A8J2ZJA0_9RHOB|nr:LysM peptidoglycan-binding domain-containing protein [Salipiger pallidus]GGG69662.1 hypothetical protein GCM10011415_16410 [Salipiger pallidus]
MIRMVLLSLAFLGVTAALLVVQSGYTERRGSEGRAPEVTRASLLSETVGTPEARDTAPVTPEAMPSDVDRIVAQALAATPEPEPVPPTVLPEASPVLSPRGDLDDDALRQMTWATMARLNEAAGRSAAPGLPGSLLHTIVQRSLSGQAASKVAPETYEVQPGDSLAGIAKKIYGDINMSGPLFAANQQLLQRPDDLKAGQRLSLPRQ